jgi:ubiquinone/menaquinone biosynthesis C-methylase UbiE
MTPPLHQMNPRSRFSDRAEDYARYRPDYPVEAIAAISEGLDAAAQLQVADVGAGTGISSRLLAERGLRVWAIEPNAAMRRAAMPHPGVIWLEGSAEATGLADQTVDIVTCFQSFHWFEPVASLREFRRILKPQGRLAVVWNNRDRSDAFTASYTEIVKRLSNQHPAESKMAAIEPLMESGEFCNQRESDFPYRQALDLPALIGRSLSSSYIPKDEASQRELGKDLDAIFKQFVDDSGYVYLTYRTQVFLAEGL